MIIELPKYGRMVLSVVAAMLLGFASRASAEGVYAFAYLARADDPAYATHRAYTGLVLRDRHRALPGAQVAIRESRIVGRALGMKFELIETWLDSGASAARTIDQLSDNGVRSFLLDGKKPRSVLPRQGPGK